MDIQFTTKSQDALGAAVRIAAANGNPQVEPLQLLDSLLQQGGDLAGLALDELKAHGLASFQAVQQGCVRGLELHRHRRPLQSRDRSVVEAERAGLEVDAVDGAFGLVADRGRRRRRRGSRSNWGNWSRRRSRS